jgi:hypothetical protein
VTGRATIAVLAVLVLLGAVGLALVDRAVLFTGGGQGGDTTTETGRAAEVTDVPDGGSRSDAAARSGASARSAQPQESAGDDSGAPEDVTTYVFPVAGCETSYAPTHHDYPAADIFADGRCSFVAPVSGRVDEIGRRDRWDPSANEGADRGGRFVSVVGDDGVRYYGSHLAAVRKDLARGTRVRAGERLGRVGQSGSARGTGTHLHFGLSWPTPQGKWWIRRGVVAPQPYLDAWRTERQRSPVAAVRKEQDRSGDRSSCESYC